MRTDSTSSLGSASTDDAVIGSIRTSTMSSDAREQAKKRVRTYAKTFTMRFIQAVVQSRTNENYDMNCNSTPSRDWFNLSYEELGEITAQIKKSVLSFPPDILCISLDFFLYTHEGDSLPLETWTFSVEADEFSEALDWHKEDDSVLYHQLGTLLKSCMCAARMTPMHRHYVKKQSPDTFIILYKVNPHESTIDLGEDSKRYDIGSLPSLAGQFRLRLAYRTRMEMSRTTTPPLFPLPTELSFQQASVALMSPGTTPESRPNVGTPLSFCEDGISHFSVSPSSAPLASPICSPPEFGCSPLRPSSSKNHPNRSRSASLVSESDSCELHENISASPRASKFFHSQMVPAGMPFANLLSMSYTGTLYPLKEEDPVTPKPQSSESVSENENSTTEKSTIDVRKKMKKLSLNDDAPPTSSELEAASEGVESQGRATFNLDDVAGELREEPLPVETSQRTLVQGGMDETIKDAAMSDGDDDDEHRKDEDATPTKSCDNALSVSDDEDSFVKIPLFGAAGGAHEASSEGGSGVDAQLGELIESCKMRPDIASFVDQISAESVIPNLESHLDQFAQHQGIFDKFVSEIRDQVEKEQD